MPKTAALAETDANDALPVRRTYRGAPIEERRRDQRERLVAGARDVFAAHGYAGAAIDDIVAAAHVSRTSFYRCFANKEECLLAVFYVGVEHVVGALAEVAAGDLEPREKVKAGVAALVRALADDPAMARVILIEVVGATHVVETARAQARADVAALIESQLRATGVWAGRSRLEVQLTAIATMAGLVESVSHLVATERLDEWPSLIEPLGRYALRALAPGEPVEAVA